MLTRRRVSPVAILLVISVVLNGLYFFGSPWALPGAIVEKHEPDGFSVEVKDKAAPPVGEDRSARDQLLIESQQIVKDLVQAKSGLEHKLQAHEQEISKLKSELEQKNAGETSLKLLRRSNDEPKRKAEEDDKAEDDEPDKRPVSLIGSPDEDDDTKSNEKSKPKSAVDTYNPPGCKAARRIVYIKTHKTGSSTLTNIFHRYALKNKLKPVLPKGNAFLGWPRSEGIPKSYVPLPNTDAYDVFCSAHTRYSHEYISAIVPDAAYVTIVREPVSHFKSSWNYWKVASHIERVSGYQVTWQEFLEDPDLWFSRTLKGDKDLLHNSVAFDFGYNHDNYTRADAEALIAHMDTFALVLITEYMDESLVLLKRKLCMELEDVVYYALKVNKRKPRDPIEGELRDKILKMNWFDHMIYEHFNRSLWTQIAAEERFDEEVLEFRQLKAKLSSQCAPTAHLDEELHRKALIEQRDMTPSVKHCHLTQMDSIAFVKYLKREWGVPDRECSLASGIPRKEIVYIKTHKTGSSTLTNIFHRFLYKHHLRPVLPKNNVFLGYANPASLPESYVKLKPFKGKDIYHQLVSAHSVYDRKRMDALVPQASYITVLRDPATHFMSSWKYWHVSDHIQRQSAKDVTAIDFLQDPQQNLALLNPSDKNLLWNSMAFDLGISSNPTQHQVSALVRTKCSVLVDLL